MTTTTKVVIGAGIAGAITALIYYLTRPVVPVVITPAAPVNDNDYVRMQMVNTVNENTAKSLNTGTRNTSATKNATMTLPFTGREATHTLDDVKAFYTIKIDNNTPGIVALLSKNNITVPPNVSRGQLGAILLDVYHKDKSSFVKILNAVPYNANTNNYTTSPEFITKLTALVNNLKQTGSL